MSHRASPTQLPLCFEDLENRPPTAAPSPDLMSALAELLLTAMVGLRDGEAGDELEDRR
jgi:hypothetical protein